MDKNDGDHSPIDIVGKTTFSEYLDEVIGHIEDIVLGSQFKVINGKLEIQYILQTNFLEKHWQQFDYNDENKLIYMDIFQEYTNVFEIFFMHELYKCMQDFNMKRFLEEFEKDVAACTTQPLGEIMELLYSLTDFQTFKELILDYRRRKEGRVQHLEFDILITKSLTYTSLKKNH